MGYIFIHKWDGVCNYHEGEYPSQFMYNYNLTIRIEVRGVRVLISILTVFMNNKTYHNHILFPQ